MIFDPQTQTLYTENGDIIKKLFCPYPIDWHSLEKVQDKARKCSTCNHLVLDTACYTEQVLVEILNSNAHTCLKIESYQTNIKIL